MAGSENGKKDLPSRGRKAGLARAKRAAAALRENLRRRKSQVRGRSQAGGDGPHDSAGFSREIAPDKPKE